MMHKNLFEEKHGGGGGGDRRRWSGLIARVFGTTPIYFKPFIYAAVIQVRTF